MSLVKTGTAGLARIRPVQYRLPQPTRLSRWMVVLTFWLFALAPAVSRALAAEAPPAWAGICSSSAGQPGGPDGARHLLEHCPLCGLQAQQDLAPPPSQAAAPLRQDLAQPMPPRFLSADAPLHAWDAALARAPPGTR